MDEIISKRKGLIALKASTLILKEGLNFGEMTCRNSNIYHLMMMMMMMVVVVVWVCHGSSGTLVPSRAENVAVLF